MKFVTDLHLHSKYSRAVSQQMVLPEMAKWARYKGIDVLATGDFTHPFWFEQLKNELEGAGNGLYRLSPSATGYSNSEQQKANNEIYFLLSCEISSIYSQGGQVRRVHNLFFFPNLESVEKFNKELLRRGANLRSDGRPIVGVTSRDLAEVALSINDKALVIPAHAWTPWFSVFGSFSGFDSIEECFGDMAEHIYGIETGLSSDPAMNWQVGDLDSRSILSFSDAHSLPKMGREATVFEANEVSYSSVREAIVNGTNKTDKSNKPEIAFTIEFYPEEGKYHYTGHRDCNFSQSPEETAQNGDTCPVCHRKLTVGVMHRVEELKTLMSKVKTDMRDGVRWIFPDSNGRPPYVSLVPLMEILAESLASMVTSKKVLDQYLILVNSLGSEFNVLLKADLADIAKYSSSKVAEGIERVRNGKIVVEPGYDGKFGVVKIWNEESESQNVGESESQEKQLNLFA